MIPSPVRPHIAARLTVRPFPGRFQLAALLVPLLVTLAPPALAAPITVDTLIRKALAAHPALVSIRETASAQRSRANGATSPYWPQVTVNSSTAQTTQVSQAQNTTAPFNLSQVGMTVRQQLWDFGKTAEEVRVAEAVATAGRMQAKLQAVDIAFGVRRTYLDWLRARGLQTQAETRLAAAKTLNAQAEAFWRAGRKPKIDVTRSQAGWLQAKADLVAATNAVQSAALALSLATGQPLPVSDEPQAPAEPAAANLPLPELQQLAAGHPSLQVGAARQSQSEAANRRADQAYWPDIVADVNYGLRARDLAPSQNWGAGVTMNMNLFRGFAEQREQDATAAQVRASTADLQDRHLQVAVSVERAHLMVGGARERVTAVAAALAGAQDNLRLAEGRYKAGVGSVIEVSDAQLLLGNVQGDDVRARTDYHQAIADLLRAIGQTGISD